MDVTARFATADDAAMLVDLYRDLEEEMTALHPMWPRADGLPEPVAGSLASAIDDDQRLVVVGEIDGFAVGLALASIETSLPQADHEPVGLFRLVYTDLAAREVGVAEVMRDLILGELRGRGISKFDAKVLPGHRLAKNFFEAGGFSARSIIMHHDDKPGLRPARDLRAL